MSPEQPGDSEVPAPDGADPATVKSDIASVFGAAAVAYDQSGVDFFGLFARRLATHLALFRDKQDYLEIIFIAPDHIDVRASPLIAGGVDEEFVMIGGYPALFSLVDAYYSLPDDFGDHWRSLPNRKTRS